MAEAQTAYQANLAKTFPWHEVYGATTTELVDFYTKVLGFTTSTMDMGGGVNYTMFENNGLAVGGVMGTEQEGMDKVPPHWSVYIGVDDVDARLAKCLELGGKLMVGPMDVPTVGRMALVSDPFGATFWLFKSAND